MTNRRSKRTLWEKEQSEYWRRKLLNKDIRAIEDLYLNQKRERKAKIIEFSKADKSHIKLSDSVSDEAEEDEKEEEIDDIEELGFYENTLKGNV